MKFDYQTIRYNCRISLMDRYLIQQLSWFFLFSLSLLTSLGVAIGTVADLANKISEYQLPIPIALLIFGCKIPEYAAYALPMAILFTSLIIYGRLNSDRELTAFFSFGITPYRIILPALVLSLIVTGITFSLNELVVPMANYQANLLQTPYITKAELNLQNQDIYLAEYELAAHGNKKLQRLYYAEEYNQPRLIRVIILSFEQEQISQIITAQSAQWNQQLQSWSLAQGTINHYDQSIKTNSTIEEKFTTKQFPFSETMFQIVTQQRNPQEMSIRQAKQYLNLIKDNGTANQIAQLLVSIQQKYAFPFICMVFVLIGCALGIKYSQLNRAKSFALCVAIVFSYYCLGFALGALGITGIIAPWLAAWGPNFIGFGVGGHLLLRAES